MGSHPKCNSGNKLRCCHSSEAILLLLSRTPQRLSIKEMSEITKFHRNTISPAVHNLKEEGRIRSFGEGRNTVYYYDGVMEHYRRIARTFETLEDINFSESHIKNLAEHVGYQLVRNTLNDALEGGPEFTHDSLLEALVHIKMAYPFNDTKLDDKSKTRTTVTFTVGDEESTADEIDENDFKLKIHPCLCRGEEGFASACSMVSGALKGAVEGACGVKSTVKRVSTGENDYGQYCEYQIISQELLKDPKEKVTSKQFVETAN